MIPLWARMRAAVGRLAGLTRGTALDARLREEIAFHIEMETKRNLALGFSAAEARRRALVTFGGRQRTTDDARDQLRSEWGYELLRDVRFALRGMRHRPGFTLTIVATLALGIGANATMFGLIDRLLLRPPAHIVDPDRVVLFNARWPGTNGAQTTQPYGMSTAMRDGVSDFASVSVATPASLSRRQYFPLGRGPSGTQAAGVLVSGNYFTTLGTRPALGRFFAPDEETLQHAQKLAVIGYGFWQSHFGGRRDAIGQVLDVGTAKYTVIGVTPKGFSGTELGDVDLWLPIEAADGLRFARSPNWATSSNSQWLYIIARLKPGVRVEHAEAQATAAARAWSKATLERPTAAAVAEADSQIVVLGSILPGKSISGFGITSGSSQIKISKLLAAVAVMVLLLACANVANLLLLRGLQRRREIAVRLALGVSRRRLIMQLLIEGMVLTAAGAAGALAVTAAASRVVRQWLLADLAWSGNGVDLRVLGFTAVVALLTGVATSLIPALQATRPDLTGSLKAGTHGSGVQRSRTRTTLLVMQAALAIVLLAGAGLFIRSVRNVGALDLGIDVDHALVGQIKQNATGMTNADARRAYDDFSVRAMSLPGVRATAVSIGLPFALSWGVRVSLLGRRAPNVARNPYLYGVTPGYFDALGIPIRAGRAFTSADRIGTEQVAIVNETMARLYWRGESPIGQCVKLDADTMPCTTVIGVAGNTHRQDIVEGLISQIYRPLDQLTESYTNSVVSSFGYDLVVRTAGDPAALVEPLRRAMQSAGPSIPYANVRTMREMFGNQTRSWYLGARVFTAFGALALVLAGIGLFSVVAFTVGQRRHELGIRTALGAQPRDLVRLTVTQGLAPAIAGIIVGVSLSLLAGRFVEAQLFGISAHDPTVLGGASAALLVCAVVASLVPAMRAARTDPTIALRAD